jgi:hypothetical protein
MQSKNDRSHLQQRRNQVCSTGRVESVVGFVSAGECCRLAKAADCLVGARKITDAAGPGA